MENSKNEKILDSINLILIFLLFISYLGYSYNKKIYYAMTLITAVFAIAKLIFIDKFKVKISRHFVWYFLFFIFSSLSIMWTIDTNYTFDGIKNVLLILVNIFAILEYTQDKKRTIQVLDIYIIACLYMCIRLIFFETAQPRVTNDYGQICGLYFNTIAFTLAIGVFVCLYMILEKKEIGRKKLLYLIPIVIFYYIIYVTGSRKGLLFPIIASPALIILYIRKNRKMLIKSLIGIGIAIVMITIFIFTDKTLTKRIINLGKSIVGIQVEDKSVEERSFYRKTAMQLFGESPIIGKGLNSFTAYMEQINYKHVAYSHCNFTELLSSLGIIGFAIYYMQYIYIIVKSGKKIKENDLENIFALVYVILISIFEYGIVSYYDFSYQIILALVFSLIDKSEKIDCKAKVLEKFSKNK